MFNKRPGLVSVAVPCYNHENYIIDCIKSIICQDYTEIELIVIDDGSSDGSVRKVEELVAECERRFLRFEFRVRENKGLCETLNEAVEWSQGEYFSAIASDDMMLPTKTSIQVDYLNNNQCSGVFGGVYLIDDDGIYKGEKSSAPGVYNFKDVFLKRKYFYAATQMLRLEDLRKALPYPKDLFIEDWYMWLRLTSQGRFLADIGIPLAKYRLHNANSSSNACMMRKARREIVDIYKEDSDYKLALSICTLSDALDLPGQNKFGRVQALIKAVNLSPKVVFDKHFYSLIARMVSGK